MNKIKTTTETDLLKSFHQLFFKKILILGLCLIPGMSCLAQLINPQYMRVSSGFARSPPSLHLPGAYLSIGVEQPIKPNISFTGEVSTAYMQKESPDVDDFIEKAFVINWDFGVDFRKTISKNSFGLLGGPVIRYFEGKSIGDRSTLGDGTVLRYQVNDSTDLYFGYYLGGYWDYEFQENLSLGLRYKTFVFFDKFSNHTLGVTFKRRL